MVIKDILKIIYSPVKAFESIVKKPDIKGPVIILALILVSAAIERSVIASKAFIVDLTPENDDWTEPKSISLWTSNGNISSDHVTYIIGNYSVRSAVSNETSIWMKITNVGTLNCSGDEGYKRFSFSMNWTHQSKASPNNFTLKLFSTSESQYFELDSTDLISKSSGNWSVPSWGIVVGSENQNWRESINSPSWENITGLEFVLKWAPANRGNLTMNIDDLFFVKKPYSFLTTGASGEYIIFSLVSTVIVFFFMWVVYFGSLFVASGMSRQKIGSWRTSFIVVGYIFAVAIVGVLIRAILLYLGLPAFSFPINVIEEPSGYSNIAIYLLQFTRYGFDLWIVALFAVSLRALGRFSWKKAVAYAVFAYFIKSLLFYFQLMI